MRHFAVLSLVALSACFLATDPQDDLVLSMHLSTTHVRADSGLTITLSAYNPTTSPIHYGPCPQLLSIAFIAPSADVPPGPFPGTDDGCAVAAEEAGVSADSLQKLQSTVLPGDSASIVLTWYFEYRGTGPRWPAGAYTARGMLWGSGSSIVREADSTFTLVCRFTDWTRC